VRHRRKGKKLGVNPSHRRALLANLAENLIIHKRIKTTDARAKELRRYIEPLVTKAKKGDMNSIRMIARKIRHKNILNILLSDIAPVYEKRNGGYTRIIKLGLRDNDRASVSLIEFVDMEGTKEIEGTPVSKETQETE
jgi:large subunit ribosomal protein L17|tara:strand:+ start:890 stop:1303 length:414 start_codon:yes stop_codon:yes gene_type:complete